MGAFGITNIEDPLITGIVMTIMSVALLAYVCLCCHVCGLHFHIGQLLRCITDNQVREQGRFDAAPAFNRYLTPPPRYSDITNSLPSYSCALRRMLQLVNGPMRLRFVVHVDKNEGRGSVLAANKPTTEDESQVSSIVHNSLSNEPETYRLQPVLGRSSTPEMMSSCPRVTSSPIEDHSRENPQVQAAIKITVESPPIDNTRSIGDMVSPVLVYENAILPSPDLAVIAYNQPNSSSLSTPRSGSLVWHNLGVNYLPKAQLNGDGCQSNPAHRTDNGVNVKGQNLQSEATSVSASPSFLENGVPGNSIKLLMRGIRGVEQVVLAKESSPNCFVAHWPIPSKEHIDADSFEVSVEGYPVDKIFVEFLDDGGQSICMAQLLPSHNSSSSVNNQTRYHYRVPISPLQTLPNLLRATSTPSSETSSAPGGAMPSLTLSSVTPSSSLPPPTSSGTPSSLTPSSSLSQVTTATPSSLAPMSSSSAAGSSGSSLVSSSLTSSSETQLSSTLTTVTTLSGET
ncbi:uncharacterized protein LOC135221822 [Macrobrachium nipponense]|uniref:uncharacterized protein LOC135221822 n=1 Tax=Macrobrachium nipponense TaxID=159736 RepID=UPI0030C7C405